MEPWIAVRLLLVAGLTAGGLACGPPMQYVTVTSAPSGASVHLSRSGRDENMTSTPIVHVQSAGAAFQEPYTELGVTPLTYGFPIEETRQGFYGPGMVHETRRVYYAGFVRVEHPGYQPAEVPVQFTGEAVTVQVALPPLAGPGAPGTQPPSPPGQPQAAPPQPSAPPAAPIPGQAPQTPARPPAAGAPGATVPPPTTRQAGSTGR